MEQATWDDDTTEPPKHTKEELVRALFRAHRIIEKLAMGGIKSMTLTELNGQVSRHIKFMTDGAEYVDFIKTKEKIEMEESVG